MSFESDVNGAVKRMFAHTKRVISKNLLSAVKNKQLTIEGNKLPGLELLISQSVDEALRSGASELNRVLAENAKKGS